MEWTVVRHKRGSASRSSAAARAHHLPSPNKDKSSASPLVGVYSAPPDSQKLWRKSAVRTTDVSVQSFGNSVEETLHGKMQRAISKVENSLFFSKFVKQMQDLDVVESLSRSRKTSKQEESLEVDRTELDMDESFDVVGKEQSQGSTVELVVYGVGSISNSEISRCQLSLALLLRQRFAAIGNILVYDPIMLPFERSVMLQLGCSPLLDNEEGRRPLNGPTLFYMPHCDVELYESVLQANLKPSSISQFVILGNSFRTYQERWSVSPLPHGERPSCLLEVQTSVEEIPVADGFSPTAFNDTSWHFFPKLKFQS